MKVGFGGLDASKGYCDFSLISKGNEFTNRRMNFIDNQSGLDELKKSYHRHFCLLIKFIWLLKVPVGMKTIGIINW
ncbi:MAG: hypothetical protein IPK35_22150 [Saprospiraceae bacterium]|nr:hypothetical protein [Saprospiraceae bacterium]MBK8053314.1 hypothetical protein [Saprospiraceae bacterium]MBK8053849.1 hypothetical protein [Saprospiraceae bacterium]MBK8055393.1 hypothetical protein [Saprospiraceae bacterium]MBK8055895.1 hypothetical protein [Saprospiraceae bacterium]